MRKNASGVSTPSPNRSFVSAKRTQDASRVRTSVPSKSKTIVDRATAQPSAGLQRGDRLQAVEVLRLADRRSPVGVRPAHEGVEPDHVGPRQPGEGRQGLPLQRERLSPSVGDLQRLLLWEVAVPDGGPGSRLEAVDLAVVKDVAVAEAEGPAPVGGVEVEDAMDDEIVGEVGVEPAHLVGVALAPGSPAVVPRRDTAEGKPAPVENDLTL